MSDQAKAPAPQEKQEKQEKQAGFCPATCMDRACVQKEIAKPTHKTSDYFATCNLPKRFEHPHWFHGYGVQENKEHPLYRTTSSQYGWYPPGYHSVPMSYFPTKTKFTEHLASTGMYRNYSLNTGMDPAGYT